MESTKFIEINQITKHFRDPASNIFFQALRGIDLTVEQGSITAIIGPSGAGKSTLLNILGGMMRPSTGTIHVDNLPLHSIDDTDLENYRKLTSGFLWQLPERNLLPNLTAAENVQFAMEVSNFAREEREKRIVDLLSSVGVQHRSSHKLGQLSGGEAQRVSLAVALANSPKLLLADEPTGELDSETTMEIIDYLKEINRVQGLTIVVVTHDNRFERMTNQSYNIVDGVISGMRRSISGKEASDWKSTIREEVGVLNKFGMIKVPEKLIRKYNFVNYIRFVEDEASGRLYIEPADQLKEGKQ
ncbi:MAG: putative ABC transporter ATP-binding protein [Candidatus Heimdallarchaeota archaeon LC_2]|nr:MAG: putative ABC transporter ATP-binding protein [Candidatus Heimdallarchaeota archaeon LC_2]